MSETTRAVRVACTVRGCGLELARDEKVWRCPAGHSFDVARSGYVNLLQPDHRRSSAPGDSREAVLARARLEERGIGAALVETVRELVAGLALERGAAALDVGAGTGALLARIAADFGLEAWALDLSTAAAEHGARARPALRWIVANADRGLPFGDGCFHLALCATGPKNPAELARVLAPDGALILTLPAPDDLIELRAAAQGEAKEIERTEAAIERFAPWFTVEIRETARELLMLDRLALDDISSATYRAARRSERERLEGVEELAVTLAADVLLLRPRGNG